MVDMVMLDEVIDTSIDEQVVHLHLPIDQFLQFHLEGRNTQMTQTEKKIYY